MMNPNTLGGGGGGGGQKSNLAHTPPLQREDGYCLCMYMQSIAIQIHWHVHTVYMHDIV